MYNNRQMKGDSGKRILTASVLIVLIGVLSYLGGMYFLFLMGCISIAAAVELHGILASNGLSARKELLMASVLLMLAGAYAGIEYFLIALYVSAMGIFIGHALKKRKNISGYMREVGISLAFITLLGTMTGSAVLLRNIDSAMPADWTIVSFLTNDAGFFFVATAFICGAVNDSVAFFIGKWKGTKKIVPNISPGKTIEGGIAGVVAATIAGALTNSAFGSPLPILPAYALGLLAGLSSVTGDLIESAVKRDCDVKDSGNLLPGHGGFFDRFDGMIFVFPVFYIFAILL